MTTTSNLNLTRYVKSDKRNYRKDKPEWRRVDRKTPCVLCSKPDWCCFTDDGLVLCMRVMSDRPSKGKAGGWLHRIDQIRLHYRPVARIVREQIEDRPDFPVLWEEMRKAQTPQSLVVFAEKLGVDPMSLHLLGCVWSYRQNAWSFPMRDENGKIVGIRLRSEDGKKWAIKGSKSGLFIPEDLRIDGNVLYVTEGPTDCAAALCMGVYAIGRPSCMGQDEMIRDFCVIRKIKWVVIISDNDEPGLIGSARLQQYLKCSSCVLTLPCKDLRDFYGYGGRKEQIESMVKNMIWSRK